MTSPHEKAAHAAMVLRHLRDERHRTLNAHRSNCDPLAVDPHADALADLADVVEQLTAKPVPGPIPLARCAYCGVSGGLHTEDCVRPREALTRADRTWLETIKIMFGGGR